MAKTTRELGLFVPPEKERQLQELDEARGRAKARVRRRMMFRWMGWGAVMVLLGAVEHRLPELLHPEAPGRLRRHRHRRAASPTSRSATSRSGPRGQVLHHPRARRLLRPVLEVPAPGLHRAVGADQDPAMPGPPDGGDLAFTDKGRFKCPCHGSIYNRYGQIIQGPAPRPMDRFPLTIDALGQDHRPDTGPSMAISRTVASASRRRPAARRRSAECTHGPATFPR